MKRIFSTIVLLLLVGYEHATATTFSMYQDFGGLTTPRTFVYDAMYIFPDVVGDLVSSDLNATEQDCLHAIGDGAFGAQNRISNATATRNCFAYMLGISYWMDDPSNSLAADYQTPTPENPRTMAVLRQRAGTTYELVHGIKFTNQLWGIAVGK